MSALLDNLSAASKAALKAQDKARLAVLRLMLAEVKKAQIDRGRDQQLDDAAISALLAKMVKQRRESADIYQKAGRVELAQQENYELSIIQDFLPEQLSQQQLDKLIDAAFSATGASSSMRDMGKLMAELKPKVQGKVDMQSLSKQLKQRLQA